MIQIEIKRARKVTKYVVIFTSRKDPIETTVATIAPLNEFGKPDPWKAISFSAFKSPEDKPDRVLAQRTALQRVLDEEVVNTRLKHGFNFKKADRESIWKQFVAIYVTNQQRAAKKEADAVMAVMDACARFDKDPEFALLMGYKKVE